MDRGRGRRRRVRMEMRGNRVLRSLGFNFIGIGTAQAFNAAVAFLPGLSLQLVAILVENGLGRCRGDEEADVVNLRPPALKGAAGTAQRASCPAANEGSAECRHCWLMGDNWRWRRQHDNEDARKMRLVAVTVDC